MNFRIAIVEDDPNDLKDVVDALHTFEKTHHILFEIMSFSNGEAFLNDYRPVYNLVLLDVELPGMNGMSVAEKLRKYDEDVPLIFTTHVASLAIAGYTYHALDYMLKPIRYEDILLRLEKIIRAAYPKEMVLPVPLEGRSGMKVLKISSLIYIESFGHTLIYHTDEGNYKVRDKTNMKTLEEKLLIHGFSRCNVSYLVNLSYLSEIDNNEVVLQNGERLPISRTKKKEFLDSFFDVLNRNGGVL